MSHSINTEMWLDFCFTETVFVVDFVLFLKEVCLIRFAPETEEDEISYTLLYAYFSSRKRFGVVSNNLKQVKDMYLIPLSATEKVPHQLVPFDGPGSFIPTFIYALSYLFSPIHLHPNIFGISHS